MHHDAEETEVATQEFDVVKSKFFNFHSVRSGIITKLQPKNYQRTETCNYKIDTHSDGHLMPIRMYKHSFCV